MKLQFDIKFHVKLQVLWDCETLTAPMLGFVCESDKDLECESRKPMNLQFDIKFTASSLGLRDSNITNAWICMRI